MMGALLLIVGGNGRNQEILARFITGMGHRVLRADSLEEVDSALEHNPPAAFALIDITGFDERIWERCTVLNARDIPLLVISPRQSSEVARLGFAHGAHSVLAKPLVMRELADVIHSFMNRVT